MTTNPPRDDAPELLRGKVQPVGWVWLSPDGRIRSATRDMPDECYFTHAASDGDSIIPVYATPRADTPARAGTARFPDLMARIAAAKDQPLDARIEALLTAMPKLPEAIHRYQGRVEAKPLFGEKRIFVLGDDGEGAGRQYIADTPSHLTGLAEYIAAANPDTIAMIIAALMPTEAEPVQHICELNRAMNGECMVCGSVDQAMAEAQHEADLQQATPPAAPTDTALVELLLEVGGERHCRCVHISRETDQEYEGGRCAHQRARKLAAALASRAAPPEAQVTVGEGPEHALVADILAELIRARAKFPGKNVTFAALVEEVGELATATFEESSERVRKEAVQVAVMAMRMILEGDHSYEPWRAEKGLDPLDPALRALAGGEA